MKSLKLFALLLIFFSFSGYSLASTVPSQTFYLNQSSYLHESSGIYDLSGSFCMGFPLCSPPTDNLAYDLGNIDFSSVTKHLYFTGYNYDLFPLVVNAARDISLGSDQSIESMSRLYLGITQTGSGSGYYEYAETYLEPVFVTNAAYNHLTFSPGELLPSSVLLTYELHSVSSRANQVVYPPGVVGPRWSYTVISDDNLGTLTINADAVAATVPEPSPVWLMGIGMCALLALSLWRRAS